MLMQSDLNPLCVLQYVGTVLNRALGKATRAEIKDDDPTMLNWVSAKGFQPQDINAELILRARNAANMSTHEPSEHIWKKRAHPSKKLCNAIERYDTSHLPCNDT